MCGCMPAYAYLVDCLKIRALLDQHSHRFHVTVLARAHQRCPTALPSQPTSVRRSGAAAATQARVHTWLACTCAHAFWVRLNEIICVYLRAAHDLG
jgi:hypothetical protein